jgi:uncharacterized protein DUF4863
LGRDSNLSAQSSATASGSLAKRPLCATSGHSITPPRTKPSPVRQLVITRWSSKARDADGGCYPFCSLWKGLSERPTGRLLGLVRLRGGSYSRTTGLTRPGKSFSISQALLAILGTGLHKPNMLSAIGRLTKFIGTRALDSRLEDDLNNHYGPGSRNYLELVKLLQVGIQEGWACYDEISGPDYRRGRIAEAQRPDTSALRAGC